MSRILKEIDGQDFGKAGVITTLLDFVPDEAHKHITPKHETTGHNSSTLEQVTIEVQKVIQRERDSQKDRTSVGATRFYSLWREHASTTTTRSARVFWVQA